VDLLPDIGVSAVEQPTHSSAGSAPKYASDLVVDLLRASGMRYLPMNPGSSFRGLHDSIVNYGGNRDPQMMLCLHEEIAVSMAHGYAKGTGGLAVCAVHDLVGLMHASMAVYNAYCDRTPVLVLGGSGPADPAERRTTDWIHSASTQAEIVRDYVVWDAEPATPTAFISDLARAMQRSLSAPRGPAYVSLDAGVQEKDLVESPARIDLAMHQPAPPMHAYPDSVQAAAELLVNARWPLVMAGRVGLNSGITEPLIQLVEMLGARYSDDRNFVSFPTAHPQNLTGSPELLDELDVVLAIDVVDLQAVLSPSHRGDRKARVADNSLPKVIDLSLGDLGLRSWSNAFARPISRTVQLLADPIAGLKQLIVAIEPLVDGACATGRCREIANESAQLQSQRRISAEQRSDDMAISQHRLVTETWQAVKDIDWLLCLRNARTWPEGIWQFTGGGEYLGHSGGGGIGYGPGAFVGGALAARDAGKLGVGIIGDGDLLMAAGALWTAVHYRIPMLMVVNDNASLYNDELHQRELANTRGRPIDNSWIGMRIAEPHVAIADLARSYGCWATGPIEKPGDLAAALSEATSAALAGDVAVVHVRTVPQ
jgi:thiamine pyrophosphate-dependent acetolactate synthase large subunit-like protein